MKTIQTIAVVLAAAAMGACGSGAGAEQQAGAGKSDSAQTADTAQQPARRFAMGSTAAETQVCMQRLQTRLDSAANALRADSTAKRPGAARNPVMAKEEGWYPAHPQFLDGSLLPCSRIVAYYGNPNSTRMGALGEFPREEMLRRLG